MSRPKGSRRLFRTTPDREAGELIPALQEIQEKHGYLPEKELRRVAQTLKMPLSRVVGVATFYAQFSLKPKGKHIIRVCLGTACHVRGGDKVFEELLRSLNIGPDGTNPDHEVAVEAVRCLGACALAPVVVSIDGKYYGGMTPAKARDLVQEILRGKHVQAGPS